MTTIPATTPATTADTTIAIPDHVRRALDESGSVGMPLLISYLDEQSGTSRPSYRGSTRMLGETSLALWVRNPAGSLPQFVAGHSGSAPVDVIYRNPVDDEFYRVSGMARLADDEASQEQVFTNAPPQEQAADPQRAGTAMIIDIVRVAGHDRTGEILVEP